MTGKYEIRKEGAVLYNVRVRGSHAVLSTHKTQREAERQVHLFKAADNRRGE